MDEYLGVEYKTKLFRNFCSEKKNFRVIEKEKEKGRREREIRIDEAFRDTAKASKLRKKVTRTRKPEMRREKEDDEVQ